MKLYVCVYHKLFHTICWISAWATLIENFWAILIFSRNCHTRAFFYVSHKFFHTFFWNSVRETFTNLYFIVTILSKLQRTILLSLWCILPMEWDCALLYKNKIKWERAFHVLTVVYFKRCVNTKAVFISLLHVLSHQTTLHAYVINFVSLFKKLLVLTENVYWE
jgi:hypothetical protein